MSAVNTPNHSGLYTTVISHLCFCTVKNYNLSDD